MTFTVSHFRVNNPPGENSHSTAGLGDAQKLGSSRIGVGRQNPEPFPGGEVVLLAVFRLHLGLLGIEANPYEVYWALNALGMHWKKEEALVLISEENIRKNTAMPWFSNRQLSTGFGTTLTTVGIDRPELWEAVGSKESKSGSDLVLRCRFIQLWLNHVVIVWKCWRTGMMDSSDWETCCRDIESILSLPAVRDEWFRVQGFYPLRFQEDMARLCLRVGEAEARE
jgi:hypothetical protein